MVKVDKGTVFHFGKWKGSSFEEICESDITYIGWCIESNVIELTDEAMKYYDQIRYGFCDIKDTIARLEVRATPMAHPIENLDVCGELNRLMFNDLNNVLMDADPQEDLWAYDDLFR